MIRYRGLFAWITLGLAIIGIVAGLFFIRHSVEEQRQAAENLARSLKRQDISITIVEGKRREEIAARLETAGITSAADFLTASAGKEGTLFPDTYRFFPNTPAADVVAEMTQNYARRTAALNPTPNQLILASIVEREASNDTERPLIAGVYQNRLDIDMRLQADPTTQYAKDTIAYTKKPSLSFTFWEPITQADYQSVQSPFNTYVVAGLPPTPIANPGLKSIAAAINPDQSNNYLYFAHVNGQLMLAKTLAQHNQQIAQGR